MQSLCIQDNNSPLSASPCNSPRLVSTPYLLADVQTDLDMNLMKQALIEARKCISVPTAYNVGAIITDSNGNIVSRGFSRELEGNTHAEEVALIKVYIYISISKVKVNLICKKKNRSKEKQKEWHFIQR